MERSVCKHGVAIVTAVYCLSAVLDAAGGVGRGHRVMMPGGLRGCQDRPALEVEEGEAEERSLSLWSLSSVDTGGEALLRETET